MHRNAAHPHGFTLIELLMAVTILAILLALATPSYGKLIGRTHGQTARNDLNASLNQARMAAVSRGRHVIICPSENQQDCSRTTQWQHGWLAFADLDHDGARSADEPIVAVTQAQPPGVAVTSTIGRMRVDFQPDGRANGTNLTLTVCDRVGGAENATSLVVNQAGRVRSESAEADAATACLRVAG